MTHSIHRTRPWKPLLLAAAIACLASTAAAQSRNTANTLRLDDPASPPAATIDRVAWMAGSWAGEAFGGAGEEVWTPPSAGTMVGTDAAYFSGLTYRRVGADQLEVHVAIERDGEVHEERLLFRRAKG